MVQDSLNVMLVVDNSDYTQNPQGERYSS
jgi:hypothetical protein